MSLDRSLQTLPLYVPTRTLSWWAAGSFLLAAAVSWTAAGFDLGELLELSRVRAGGSLAHASHLARQRTETLMLGTQVAATLVLAGTFLPWLYQVRCNLRAFGRSNLRFGRDWTYLGFLVPLLNLVRPYQVMSEVWRGSHSEPGDPLAWQRVRTHPLVAGWWTALIAAVVIALVSSLLFELAHARVQSAHALGVAANASAALSASLGFLVVTRVERAQQTLAESFAPPEEVSRSLEGQHSSA